MKNSILLTVLFAFIAITAQASNDIPGMYSDNGLSLFGTEVEKYIEEEFELFNSNVICKMDKYSRKSTNIDFEYDNKDNSINISSEEEISFLQILESNGQLMYQIPVQTDSLFLSIEDFKAGKYQVNLLLGNCKKIVVTSLERL